MRQFWELVSLSIRRQLTYRTATIAGLIKNFFFGIFRAEILVALYGSRSVVEGISTQGAITFAVITQVTIAYLSIFHWYDIMDSIYSGEISSDLLKPIGYFRFWMAKDIGRAIVVFFSRGVILFVGYAFLYDIYWPTEVISWIAVFSSVIFSWLLSFTWRYLINLSAFWTPNAIGILRFFFAVSWFFSGFLMPLRYFPDWVVNICYLTPFPHMLNTVIEIYLGILSQEQLLFALLSQLIWIGALFVAGHFALRAGIRRLVILGG